MTDYAEEALRDLMELPPWIQHRLQGLDRNHLREIAYAALLMSDGPENVVNSDVQRAQPDINAWQAIVNPSHPHHTPIVVSRTQLMNTFTVYKRLTPEQLMTARELQEEQYAEVVDAPTWD